MEAKKITLLKSAPFMLFLFLQATVYAFSPLTQAPFRQISNAAFAARISQQPVTINDCTGGTAVFTIEVEGAINPSYVWQKNGEAFLDNDNVSGATTSTLTITNFTTDDFGAYSCYVIDLAGNLQSEVAYLNAGIVAENGSTTCSGTATAISVEAVGENVQYQWYASGSANTNINGILIEGATQSTYAPPINENGTFYYYVMVQPAGLNCAANVSRPIAVNIGNTSAGRASANVIVCPNGSGTVSLTGSFGEIQWQQSPDGVDGWVNVRGGMGANNPIYITPALTAPVYYRAVVGNLTCGVVYSDVIAATIAETYVWTGSESDNWFDAGNWACNIVPTLNESVTISGIAGVQPVVESGVASAKSITILDGASLTVNTGATLRIQNNVTVDEGGELLVLNNAALIQDSEATNSGLVKVIKNGNPLYRLDYTMWSAPVTGQQLLAFSPATLQSRFYEYAYNASQQAEQYQLTSPLGNFTAAKGYLIRMPDSDALDGYSTGAASMSFPGTFIGSLNNGEITIPASVNGNRFTAVGNPYPSPISINDFYAANENTLQEGSAIYLWRKRNNAEAPSYATVSKAGYVANTAEGGGAEQAGFYTETSGDWILSQGQGFLVKTAEAPTVANITFNNSMRRKASANGSQPFFRQGQNAMSRLWINMTGAQGEFSQTAVAYIEGATTGMDYGYDGQMINDSAPVSLYSISSNVNLAIQARPAFTNDDVVTMGFKAGSAGQYTLSLDHVDGTFAGGQKIYIKDNVTGVVSDMADGYTFTTEAGTFNNRFEVVYTTQALSVDNPALAANSVIIYKDGSSLNINTGTAQMSDVSVYDVRGRTLYSNSNIGSTQTSIADINAQQQVLIVEVNTEHGKISKKVVF